MGLNFLTTGKFCMILSSGDYFSKSIFLEKIQSGIQSECQTVWVQIRTDILSVLIWVQTVCKGYQQTTLVDKEESFLS